MSGHSIPGSAASIARTPRAAKPGGTNASLLMREFG